MELSREILPISPRLITQVPDKVFLWDRNGIYLSHFYRNQNLRHFRGPRGFLNKHIFDVLPNEIATGLLQTIQLAFTTGQTQTHFFELPLEGIPYQQSVRLFPYGDRVLGVVYDKCLIQ